jgi:hypothetical protein
MAAGLNWRRADLRSDMTADLMPSQQTFSVRWAAEADAFAVWVTDLRSGQTAHAVREVFSDAFRHAHLNLKDEPLDRPYR